MKLVRNTNGSHVSFSTDVPREIAKSFALLLEVGGGTVKERLEELNRNSCRKTEYITIPYSNDSQTIKHG